MARPSTRLLAVRITGPMLRRLDDQMAALQAQTAWASVRRTDVVRVLLLKALEGPPLTAVPMPAEPQDCLVSVRVPSELIERIDVLTRSLGPTVSRSDVVRALFVRALASDNHDHEQTTTRP